MKIIPITDLTEQLNTTPAAIALGNFDGVHLGHRALVERTKKDGLLSAAFTFEDRASGIITPLCEKARLFESLGVSLLFVANFALFKSLSPEEFVRYLTEKLSASLLVCGYNFRFGKGAVGTADTLVRLSRSRGISAEVENEVRRNGKPISSTVIRTLLERGEIASAEDLLGHPYLLSGEVIKGFGIGKKLSFATLNLALPTPPLVPQGVYLSEVTIDRKRYDAITNIGNNPTFSREFISCETHLIDVEGEFYHKVASLHLLSFLRGEKTFASAEELKAEVLSNVETARAFHRNRKRDV